MSSIDTYERLIPDVRDVLAGKGIRPELLQFGGEGQRLSRMTIPTDSRSEFLANRAMGDWAERTLARTINGAGSDFKVVHYGNANRIAAGESGFRDFYRQGLEDVRIYGKRPDLLAFAADFKIADDISTLESDELDKIIPKALGGIEVRSSKFEALRYMRVRLEELKAGKKGGRSTPSFTVKVEDLKIVYRWLERYQVPQLYCQVFFDSVYVMNFLGIFQIIASGEGFSLEKPKKSQEKATIMIPITRGARVGTFETMPRFEVSERVTNLGRHDAYVIPKGGVLRLEVGSLKSCLLD